MIETNTVFVLGAGAHASYGFPTGAQLKERVASQLRGAENLKDDQDLFQIVPLGLTDGRIIARSLAKETANALMAAGQLSIDAYLNNNDHVAGIGMLGKAAISQVLLHYEEIVGNGGASKDDWLAYLFAEMARGVKGSGEQALNAFISGNKVSFVTFNYDRFLERWLHWKLQHSYGVSSDAALAASRKIPICHTFGMLGAWPPTHNLPAWVEGCKNIKLIHEAEAAHQEVIRASQLLADAHVIGILGFGYHDENISLIGLDGAVIKCKGFVGSSAYGMTGTEWTRRIRPFKGREIVSANMACRGTLENLQFF
jgi:hypothetical protein